MSAPHLSLRRSEASSRRALLDVTHHDVTLDLTGEANFSSRTVITFTSEGGDSFVDVRPERLRSITLDGDQLPPGRLDHGRFPLRVSPGSHELVVHAEMAFRNDGEGLHLHVDPADGRRYVYAMSFMDAAPSIFACFDPPDLKAPLTLHVTAPADWTVVGNAPVEQAAAGRWDFRTTPPLSTYFVTLVAGPYHLITDSHDGIQLGLSARQSLAGALDREADELLALTRQCFDEFHRLFGIRYPFGNYHQAFVPEFNAGAMENPGCVTYRDAMVFESRVSRASRIHRATTVAHEMAHQWFGNIVTPRWWDDLWLNESFAEYMGTRVTADVTMYGDAWTHHAYARRQWGLVADQRPSTHPVAGNGAADAATRAVLRTPATGEPTGREHTLRIATADLAGAWSEETVHAVSEATAIEGEPAVLVIDPYEDTWAATQLDHRSVTHLKELLPRTKNARLRAGVWNALRSGVHQGVTSPEQVLGVLEATMPTETSDDALGTIGTWALSSVVPVHADPEGVRERLHAVMAQRLASAEQGSGVQLVAFQSVVASTTDALDLLRWLEGDVLPGVALDLDLRWAVLVRLATLGAVRAADLDHHLDLMPTARARIEHARAQASRPTAPAKSWAWARFSGEVSASNYELEAAGSGMWQPGQDRWSGPWVERYFALLPSLPSIHSGWVLGTAVRSFFPLTSLEDATLSMAQQTLSRGQLDPTVMRNLADLTDELARRLRARGLARGSSAGAS